MRNMFGAVLGFAGGVAATLWYLANRTVYVTIPEDFGPGDWFGFYLDDWMEDHDVCCADEVTSGFVVGADTGRWIWVTNTPEWDQEWFDEHGGEFPDLWVPYAALEDCDGEPGSVIKLPGL